MLVQHRRLALGFGGDDDLFGIYARRTATWNGGAHLGKGAVLE